ncbi:uncharacterized protein KY384_008785 [Bacidia gigantensis]|uniref:uncharacterized protein n=1 Tax=Bacidia gigantensis TaxID=2732470 RepID=UPI001D04A6DC|nr:uncharacterized protein KY384_008785 [Bacidia gigantensis]KAG8526584.1 hypothetical protein KY384_008785 [Bacidia gigantensis]
MENKVSKTGYNDRPESSIATKASRLSVSKRAKKRAKTPEAEEVKEEAPPPENPHGGIKQTTLNTGGEMKEVFLGDWRWIPHPKPPPPPPTKGRKKVVKQRKGEIKWQQQKPTHKVAHTPLRS